MIITSHDRGIAYARPAARNAATRGPERPHLARATRCATNLARIGSGRGLHGQHRQCASGRWRSFTALVQPQWPPAQLRTTQTSRLRTPSALVSDEHAPRLDLLAHQPVEDLGRRRSRPRSARAAGDGPSGPSSSPELRGIHLAQPLVALDGNAAARSASSQSSASLNERRAAASRRAARTHRSTRGPARPRAAGVDLRAVAAARSRRRSRCSAACRGVAGDQQPPRLRCSVVAASIFTAGSAIAASSASALRCAAVSLARSTFVRRASRTARRSR